MPSTVGQIIINGRQLVPDMPQVLPATVATVTVVATGSPSQTPIGAASNGTVIQWNLSAPLAGTIGQQLVTSGWTPAGYNGTFTITGGDFISTIITGAQGVPAGTATVAGTLTLVTSTLPQGTYDCEVTQRNPYGETLASGETTGLVVGFNQGIQIASTLQPSATTIRAYLTLPGGASGTEQQFIESAVSPFVISTPLPNAGTPPQLNRAFLPDTDGGLISCTAVYGWLNDGLRMISRHAGGLLDYSGIGSVSNQPLYTMPGEWIAITSIWYDGYWMMGGDRGYFWRRNNITSQILSSATISVINNQNILEVYPQPARTGSTTTLFAAMLATDNIAQLTSTAGFLLPFGFFQVDNEVMGYNAIQGQNLIGVLRGLGGSAAVAHAINAPVKELNIFWNGKRQIEPSYVPGQSTSIVPLPSGWDILLSQYVGGRAKNIEHDGQYWRQLEDNIKQSLADFDRPLKGVMRRRQVGPPTAPATFYNTPAGGLLIN